MRYLAGWVLLCVLLSSVARAADDPNLIVVTEDIHEGAIPRSSQVYKAVLMNLQEQMPRSVKSALILVEFLQVRICLLKE